ncbi:MAG: hypothetical protein ACFFC3_15330, partial [Candidatus Odinarchaeota archaeon]
MEKKTTTIIIISCLSIAIIAGVGAYYWIINAETESDDDNDDNDYTTNLGPAINIIDHNCAHLKDLKSIPIKWINAAKVDLNIAYGHTSHGSQLTTGMDNLDAFMGGNDIYIFGSDGGGDDTKLEFYDYNSGFGGPLTTTLARDLGNPTDDAWAAATEEYLDNYTNP